MEALWLIPILVIGVGMVFMVRAFIRLGGAMKTMRESLSELGSMAPRLQKLSEEMAVINRTLEERARAQGEQGP